MVAGSVEAQAVPGELLIFPTELPSSLDLRPAAPATWCVRCEPGSNLGQLERGRMPGKDWAGAQGLAP